MKKFKGNDPMGFFIIEKDVEICEKKKVRICETSDCNKKKSQNF